MGGQVQPRAYHAGNLPDGFAVMNANDQIVNLLNRILQRGDYLGEPHSPASTVDIPTSLRKTKLRR